MPYFWQLAINPKFNNFLWVCWFLCKNLSDFVPPAWKLHNSYYHNGEHGKLTCLAMILVMQSKTRSEDTVSWKFKDCNNLAKDSSTIFCFKIGSSSEFFSKLSLFFNLDRCIRKIVAKSNNKPLPSIWFNLLNKDLKRSVNLRIKVLCHQIFQKVNLFLTYFLLSL